MTPHIRQERRLEARYFAVLRSLAWTAAALDSAGLEGWKMRLATLLGPLVVLCGAVGQAMGWSMGRCSSWVAVPC